MIQQHAIGGFNDVSTLVIFFYYDYLVLIFSYLPFFFGKKKPHKQKSVYERHDHFPYTIAFHIELNVVAAFRFSEFVYLLHISAVVCSF